MPVQRCPQCGTPRRGDLQVCVRCETPFPGEESADDVDLALPRPAAPSPTQSHGTLMVALLTGFVVLAVLLYFSVRGVGPFTATVVGTGPASGDRVDVTVSIKNEGRRAGHGKCAVQRVNDRTGDLQTSYQFLSERVPAHGTITQTVTVPLLAGQHAGQVDC